MSKKPAAALSAGLVAVKGAAEPSPDMTGRTASAMPSVATSAPVEESSAGQGDTGGKPLNFRVSDAFRREFKVFAASHSLKLNELLRLSFEAYRRQNGN